MVACSPYAAPVAVLVQLVVSALIAAFGLVAPASGPAGPPNPDYCGLHYGQALGEVFTWQGFTFQKYVGDAACETHRQGTYSADDVSVDDSGDLVISASRDCGWPSPCGAPTYSIGRVKLVEPQMGGIDFEWGFEAKLPEASVPGARSALWLVNLEHIQCDPLWGELDVLEWYSFQPDKVHSATHVTCSDAEFSSWHHKPDTSAWEVGGPTGFHRYAVRKQGLTVSYLFDGEVYATDTCTDAMAASTCAAVLDRPWTAILQTAVFADDSGPFTRPDPDAAFPTQSLVVRDMWVRPAPRV
jgi:hypothetical protein